MLSSSHPSSSQRDAPTRSNSASDHLPELSDVPCYTCRRRHVRCDRILPYCAKCRKRGIECLGYQKPLRWADGVAVRGKLKGKSQPVVDDNAMDLVRNSIQQQVDSVLQEAAQSGFHPSDNSDANVVACQSQCDEIVAYYNSTFCSDSTNPKDASFYHKIAPLTREYAHKLPKSIVNCLLGISTVHMMSRNPGNTAIERLALETKVNVFQSHNQLLRVPQQQLDQRPDVVVSCGILIFAMDLFDHGMSRWIVHTLGMMHVMSWLGGIQNLALYYPHLHAPLLQVSLFETMWVVTSHIPLTKYKQCSRNALELLIQSPYAKSKILNGCATPLVFAIWDTTACAQKIFGDGNSISPACIHTRQRILADVLSFQPEHGTRDLVDKYHQHDPLNIQTHTKYWNLVGEAWKAAIIILVLRYLYFGRPELVPPPQAPDTEAELSISDQYPETWRANQFYESADQDYLTAGTYFGNSLSRSPSPMPSPRLPTESNGSNIWETRYDIHMEAFSTLASTLDALRSHLGPTSFGLVLLPVIILGLVSRPSSEERELCRWYVSKFLEPIASTSLSPTSDETLGFEIPWEKLDAYAEIAVKQRGEEGTMEDSAPEWNWWDMLKHIDLDLSWPATAGHSHLEQGPEYWALNFISSVANEETFNIWSQEPTTTQSFTPSN